MISFYLLLCSVHQDAEAPGQLLLRGDGLHHREAVSERRGRNVISDVAIVILGDDEHVRGHQRLHVAEGDALLVLVDLVGGNLTCANLAQSKLHIADIRVSAKEFRQACWQADRWYGHEVINAKDTHIFNANDVLRFKQKWSL